MAKDRWVNNKKINEWIENHLQALDEWGGHGSAVDAMANLIDDNHFMSLHTEGLKAIDVYECVNGGVQFGQNAEAMNCKIFYIYYNSINLYFLAKNITDLKHMVLKAIHDWKEGCDPLEPLPPTKEERIDKLLREIRNSWIGDPSGQSMAEVHWCKEIDEILA